MAVPVKTLERIVGGKYRLEEIVGEGGYGVVYRATHMDLDLDVAVKILREPNEETIEHFRREARRHAEITSPHVVRIRDAGQDDGTHYLVMDYVKNGENLQRLETEQLTLEDSLTIMDQISDGLQDAHAHGIFHRDVNRKNVMISRDRNGRILKAALTDFGSGARDGEPIVYALSSPIDSTLKLPIEESSEQLYLTDMMGGQDPERRGLVHTFKELMGDGEIPKRLQRIIDKASQPVFADNYPNVTAFRQALADFREREFGTSRRNFVKAAILTGTVALPGQFVSSTYTPSASEIQAQIASMSGNDMSMAASQLLFLTYKKISWLAHLMQRQPEDQRYPHLVNGDVWDGTGSMKNTAGDFVEVLWRGYRHNLIPLEVADFFTSGIQIKPSEERKSRSRRFYGSHAMAFYSKRKNRNRHREIALMAADYILERQFDQEGDFLTSSNTVTNEHGSKTIGSSWHVLSPILWFAFEQTGDEGYKQPIDASLETTMEMLVREDYSVSEYTSFDSRERRPLQEWPLFGNLEGRSHHSLSQAATVYGFTEAFMRTGNTDYLHYAAETARFFVDHLPANGIPYYDLIPTAENPMEDSGSAAIASVALWCLSRPEIPLDQTLQQHFQLHFDRIMHTLSTPEYLALGFDTPEIVRHTCKNFNEPDAFRDTSSIKTLKYYTQALELASMPTRQDDNHPVPVAVVQHK